MPSVSLDAGVLEVRVKLDSGGCGRASGRVDRVRRVRSDLMEDGQRMMGCSGASQRVVERLEFDSGLDSGWRTGDSAMNKAERISLVTMGAALSLLLGEGIFFLVGAGACYRLFTHDFPAQPGRRVTAYYLGVLVLLAWVMWTLPAVPAARTK